MSGHRSGTPNRGAWLYFRITTERMVLTGRRVTDRHGKVHDTRHHGLFADGKLVWGSRHFHARSGPWGNGALPDGIYVVERHGTQNPKTHVHGHLVENKGMALDLMDQAGHARHVAFKIGITPENQHVHRSE